MTDQPKPSNDIRDRIERGIVLEQADGSIQNAVVFTFVNRENTRRVDLLVKGFDELAKLAKNFDDINKPDQRMFSNDSPVSFTSEKRRKEQEAALKKLNKLSAAIDNAFLNADYAGLEKALKGGGDKADRQTADTEE